MCLSFKGVTQNMIPNLQTRDHILFSITLTARKVKGKKAIDGVTTYSAKKFITVERKNEY